jgi:ferrochelatase
LNSKGILLVNLGSPRSTAVNDVKEYLDEFLMDEKVIDYRWIFRALLVQGIILKTRPAKSAEAYKTVWTDEGSPLIVITEKIQRKLQKLVDVPVEIGMRYAEPSIETGIQKLVDQGISEIVLFPLYPQYAMSTTETVIEKAEEVRKRNFHR